MLWLIYIWYKKCTGKSCILIYIYIRTLYIHFNQMQSLLPSVYVWSSCAVSVPACPIDFHWFALPSLRIKSQSFKGTVGLCQSRPRMKQGDGLEADILVSLFFHVWDWLQIMVKMDFRVMMMIALINVEELQNHCRVILIALNNVKDLQMQAWQSWLEREHTGAKHTVSINGAKSLGFFLNRTHFISNPDFIQLIQPRHTTFQLL